MVKPKKHLGQHFLTDEGIAMKIVDALQAPSTLPVLEIGPGTGVLSKYLMPRYKDALYLVDVDRDSVAYLREHYPEHAERVYDTDFLKSDLTFLPKSTFAVIGNFPYNISSQIFFKILEHRDRVTEVVCMLQKEVARRLTSPPGNKEYGILSVLLQAFYDMEYLFTVGRGVFDPPPKVESGVIRLTRITERQLNCDYDQFKQIVKQGFQNRRKTLRNALKPLNLPAEVRALPLLDKRAEALSVTEFEYLTNEVQKWSK